MRLILVLGLGCFASSLASRILEPFIGELAGEFATAPERVALLATAFALPYALVQPVLGLVGDTIGKRRVVLGALVGLLAACLTSALAQDLGWLFALRVLAGGTASGIFPLCIAIIGDRVPIERRQIALSRLLVAGLSGQVCGGALAGAFGDILGWRGLLALCGVVAGLAALVVRADPGSADPPSAARPSLAEAVRRYGGILGLRAARKLYGAVFLEACLIFGLFPFVAPLLAARGIGGTTEAGLSLACFGIGGFGFAALAPLLLRRLGQSRMVRLGGATAALAMVAIALAPLAWLFVGAFTLLGLGFYMMHTSIQTRATEVAPNSRGSAVALHAFSFFLGQSLGPVLFGLAQSALGAAAALMACAGGVVLLGLWLGATLQKAPPR